MKCINEKCNRGLWTKDGCLLPSESEACVDFIPEPKQAEAAPSSAHIELAALRINYLIAQKNWISAVAERETSLDGWMCNHTNDQMNIDLEIEELFKEIKQSYK